MSQPAPQQQPRERLAPTEPSPTRIISAKFTTTLGSFGTVDSVEVGTNLINARHTGVTIEPATMTGSGPKVCGPNETATGLKLSKLVRHIERGQQVTRIESCWVPWANVAEVKFGEALPAKE